MDRSVALNRLPEIYARALKLRDLGFDEKRIAEQLEIAEEAVGPCLEVAQAKLAKLLDTAESANY